MFYSQPIIRMMNWTESFLQYSSTMLQDNNTNLNYSFFYQQDAHRDKYKCYFASLVKNHVWLSEPDRVDFQGVPRFLSCGSKSKQLDTKMKTIFLLSSRNFSF